MTARENRDSPWRMENDPDWKTMLATVLEDFGCQTGTIHRATPGGDFLDLVCQIGVPETLHDKISCIPFGKGIAGVAAETREPVELCNLQQDLEGVAKPDARQTGVSGSLAVPVFSADGLRVIGTVGIGKYAPYVFSDEEKQRLADFARRISADFGPISS